MPYQIPGQSACAPHQEISAYSLKIFIISFKSTMHLESEVLLTAIKRVNKHGSNISKKEVGFQKEITSAFT